MERQANKTSFKPGHGGGRPPGTPNKLTRTVKDTVLAVFNDLQNDPKVNLQEWAKNNATEFYRIAAKLIPTDIRADLRHAGKVILEIKRGHRAGYLQPDRMMKID